MIDWDGSVVISCQVRSDTAGHKGSVVGTIGQNGTSMVEAYVALAGWRDSLKGFGPEKLPGASSTVARAIGKTRRN